MHAAFLGMTFSSIGGIISGVGTAVTLCFGTWNVLQNRMTVGEMMAFCAWAGYLYSPTARLTEIANTLQQAGISMLRIFEIFDTAPEVKESMHAIELPKIKGQVRFDQVSFEYLKGQKVLEDINLDIHPGTIVALVGQTGCGKTTITSLLLRFYDVTKGKITIDGYNIRDITLNSLHNQIGVVLQDPVLFNETIKENIRYGETQATDEQVVKSATIAEIHHFISGLPEQYATKLGEEGVKLSVGEKQRLAIARAVVGEPAILILDEATSSLDSESESLIQKALTNVMKGKTCFIIAHRLSTIVKADLIIVMDKGKIVELGNHRELVNKPNGYYAALYRRQFTIPFKTAIAAK
jgi:ATP-binding cassette subfamily B protein